MQKQKLSLATMQGKLSREELKEVKGGYMSPVSSCTDAGGTCKTCQVDWCKGHKYCSNGLGSC